MMSVLFVALESFRLLRREGLFWVPLGFLFFALLFSQLLASLFLRSHPKAFMDSCLFFYHFIGGSVFLFWGVQVLGGGNKPSAFTVRLCLPISRRSFALGSLLGLSLSCLVFFVLSLSLVQFFLFFNHFGSVVELWPLFFSEWLFFVVMLSLGFFLSTFLSPYLSLFAGGFLWFLGLISHSLARAADLTAGDELVSVMFSSLSSFWDLRIYHLDYFDYQGGVPLLYLGQLSLQALVFFGVFFFLGSFLFERKDLG